MAANFSSGAEPKTGDGSGSSGDTASDNDVKLQFSVESLRVLGNVTPAWLSALIQRAFVETIPSSSDFMPLLSF